MRRLWRLGALDRVLCGLHGGQCSDRGLESIIRLAGARLVCCSRVRASRRDSRPGAGGGLPLSDGRVGRATPRAPRRRRQEPPLAAPLPRDAGGRAGRQLLGRGGGGHPQPRARAADEPLGTEWPGGRPGTRLPAASALRAPWPFTFTYTVMTEREREREKESQGSPESIRESPHDDTPGDEHTYPTLTTHTVITRNHTRASQCRQRALRQNSGGVVRTMGGVGCGTPAGPHECVAIAGARVGNRGPAEGGGRAKQGPRRKASGGARPAQGASGRSNKQGASRAL